VTVSGSWAVKTFRLIFGVSHLTFRRNILILSAGSNKQGRKQHEGSSRAVSSLVSSTTLKMEAKPEVFTATALRSWNAKRRKAAEPEAGDNNRGTNARIKLELTTLSMFHTLNDSALRLDGVVTCRCNCGPSCHEHKCSARPVPLAQRQPLSCSS
jgi:hypothetical protein